MKGKSILCAVAILGFASMPVFGEYVSIQHNLIDGIGDTTYIGGVLRISTDSNALTLNDPTPLGGTIANGHVDLETYFHSFNPGTGEATFVGGSFDLTFDHEGSPYEMSGPIDGMVFIINSVTQTYSTIDGEGLFTAVTKNLPGSGIWPDGGLRSSIDSLTLGFNVDLTTYDWSEDMSDGRLETIYGLFPDERAVPEPASGAILLLGVVALLRRRR